MKGRCIAVTVSFNIVVSTGELTLPFLQLTNVVSIGSQYGRLLTERGMKKLDKQIRSAGGYMPISEKGGLEDWVQMMVRVLLPDDTQADPKVEKLGMVDGDHRKGLFDKK